MTLEELKREKRKIEAQIKQLQNNGETYKNLMIDKETYPTHLPDRWHLSVKVKAHQSDGSDKYLWRSIINGGSREEVISNIAPLIENLKQYLQILEGEKNV